MFGTNVEFSGMADHVDLFRLNQIQKAAGHKSL